MSNIVIDIAAEFTGNKAFKQAENETDKLIKNVKKLAKTLGIAYGSQQILAFGKASIKAAAADQKAQQQLSLALKNVGLERDAATSEAFIQKLQSEFGVVDDQLRPAYQRLAVATHDTAESQKLLQLSLDISASTGKDLESVTAALSKAYLGNNTALSKLGVGISKADLKAGNFNDIIDKLTVTFAGSAKQAANSYQGSIDKLGVASQNVKEIIGTGLIDAIKNLAGETGVSDLAKNMENAATYTADVIRGIGVLTAQLKKLPGVSSFDIGMIPIVGSYLKILQETGKQSRINAGRNGDNASALADLARLESLYKTKTLDSTKKITTLTAQQLKDARAKAILDKANAALNKGTDLFNMDAIQIQAALINQAEQLGKATTSSQILQIANDTARLKIKQDILDLEAAIAAGDEASITAATNKLNADMKILSSLQQQNLKLIDIKSLLESLVPKDLINLANLQSALALLNQINLASIGSKTIPASTVGVTGVSNTAGNPVIQTPNGITSTTPPQTIAQVNKAVEELGGVVSVISDNGKEFIKLVEDAAPIFQQLEDSMAKNLFIAQGILTQPFNAGTFRAAEGGSIFSSGAVGSRDINITIQANTIANPDELTNLVQDAIIKINRQGSSLTQAGAL
jgi:hypothetical protein